MTQATRAQKTFEAGDRLPDEYRELLYRLLKVAADTETSLLFPETDWLKGIIDLAPTPADRIRITRLYWEELNHGWFFYKIWEDLGVTPKADDYLGARDLYFASTPLETWTDVALMNCLSDRVGLYQYRNMEGCSYLPLGRIVPKIGKDEVGHATLGYQNLKTICSAPEGKAEAQRLLPKWYPVALDMFGRSESTRDKRYVQWGLKKLTNQELRKKYLEEVNPLLHSLGLEPPPETKNRRFL